MVISTSNAQISDSVRKKERAVEIGGGISFMKQPKFSYYKLQKENGADIWSSHRDAVSYMPGVSLFANKEISDIFTVDVNGNFYFDKDGNKLNYLAMLSMGLQVRMNRFLQNRYIDPYFRLGGNIAYNQWNDFYMSKDMSKDNLIERTETQRKLLYPISTGVGINSWFNDHIGVGVECSYMIMPHGDVANTYNVGARIMFRIGGESKKTECKEREYINSIIYKTDTIYVYANTLNMSKKIRFKDNGIDITDDSHKYLTEMAKLMKNNPDFKFLVTGFKLQEGEDVSMARQRAENIKSELVRMGVNPDNIITRGVDEVSSDGSGVIVEKLDMSKEMMLNNRISALTGSIRFKDNSSILDEDCKEQIKELAKIISSNPDNMFVITGYPDEVVNGGEYISSNRAYVISDQLIREGVSPNQLVKMESYDLSADGEQVKVKTYKYYPSDKKLNRYSNATGSVVFTFDFDSSVIADSYSEILDDMAENMLENNYNYLITGFSDNVGGKSSRNKILSIDRANAIVVELMKRGVPIERLKARGVSNAISIAPANANDEIRASDRKAMIERVYNNDYWNLIK